MSNSTKTSFLTKSVIAAALLATGSVGIYLASSSQDLSAIAQQKTPKAAPLASKFQTMGTSFAAASAQPLPGFLSPLTAAAQNTYGHDAHEGRMQQVSPVISAEAMARMELPDSFVPSNSKGSKENAPFSHIQLPEFTSGQKAIQALGENLNAVAQWYGMSADGLRQLLLTDSTVHLDRKGRMLHIDSGIGAGNVEQPRVKMAAGTLPEVPANNLAVTLPFPSEQTFTLHSRPNSTRILYLNFVGNAANPAFSLDNTPSTFSDTERQVIQKVWQRVVEDYAPFDVDVTTEAPTNVSGKIGATIYISPQADSAGGWAYLYSFSNDGLINPPAYCFPNNLGNSEKPIAECVSHELGHTLGLRHQGTINSEYYYGQGNGETSWAPIMGTGYYKNLTQWSKGEYANANNKTDVYSTMAIMGLKIRTDDHGNTIPYADPLTSLYANGYNNLNGSGTIETQGDIDVFSFNANVGVATFNVSTADLGGNLDLEVQILDVNGNVLATANPESTLAATITVNIPKAAMYFVTVKGVGKGDPLVDGYTNYGSLGQYFISGTTAIIYVSPPAITVTPSASTGVAAFNVNFSAAIRCAIGSRPATYEWNFGDGAVVTGASTATTQSASHIYTQAGTYDAILKLVDSRGYVVYRGTKITVN